MRKQGSSLVKEIMQGTMPGVGLRRRGIYHARQDSPWNSQSEWQL